MEAQKTVKINIWGVVQGVGFRPFVAKLADRFGLKGEVRNLGGLVEIFLTDTPTQIEDFLEALRAEKPLPAEIVHLDVQEAEFREFSSFLISDSEEGGDEAVMLPADLSLCEDCLRELWDSSNPRFRHSFISCMACGPRYTIIDKVPYDRKNTSMDEFSMCDFCLREYTDRQDRRYHAQTVSCHHCGPMLEYQLPSGTVDGDKRLAEDDALVLVIKLLNEGQIIGLKGVGGYYFCCLPGDQGAVSTLRRLKGREEKPFAVMFTDMKEIKKFCRVSQEEEALLLSSAKPIVLLERRQTVTEQEICKDTYRSSRFIGAFLPSMGLQHLLLAACGPLIMTSANLSDMPIIKEEEEMFSLMDEKEGLSGVFYNKRKIRVSLDDSVARIIDGHPQMIRRSKGYVPVPLHLAERLAKEQTILATGGQLKSSFALSKGPFSYVSQFFGDLDSREACGLYEEHVGRMAGLLRIAPKLVVCDLHPLYFTSQFAEAYAKDRNLPLIKVQHHHAHIASVMAEHDLQGPVLGVSFDGTGYGLDGRIWGGEFLLCEGAECQRLAHLEDIRMVGGDRSMKEGWKSAMCYLFHLWETEKEEAERITLKGTAEHDTEMMSGSALKDLYAKDKWTIVSAALKQQINTIQSSSMGRLFDAVASLTGIHDENSYEGECAILLENAAVMAVQEQRPPLQMSFAAGVTDKESGIDRISATPIISQLMEGRQQGVNQGSMALGFHWATAEMICRECCKYRESTKVNQVALSGGVFQNKLLMERTLTLLRREGFTVFYNISVSPNDGGICLGQNYIGMKLLQQQ